MCVQSKAGNYGKVEGSSVGLEHAYLGAISHTPATLCSAITYDHCHAKGQKLLKLWNPMVLSSYQVVVSRSSSRDTEDPYTCHAI